MIISNSYGQLSQLHLDNGIIKDTNNRTIILNGCVTITHHGSGFQPYTLADYERLKSWGANYQSIRLFASTIGAEGSTTFLVFYQAIDSMISRAKQVGIYTEFKLTMYGNTTYNWEDLWLNNGTAQQDLINGWQSVWTRYINEPAVIGYDLINEPEQSTLSTPTDSVFVCEYLNPLYQKLIDSLQSIDPNKFAFIQPALDGFNVNTGVVDYYEYPCSINRSNVFYAPHFYVKINYPYDVFGYTNRINRFINEAQLHNAPLFIGEYGIPWNKADDGNTSKEIQYSITEKSAVSIFDSLKIGFSRPWFADDNAEVSGIPQLNWALIKGTSGLNGNEREFITNEFSRPYPKATAGNLLDYQFYYDENRFEMTYTSDVSTGNTEIFTAKNRYFKDTLVLQYNNNCFLLDPVTGTFQVLYNPDGLNPSNFIWDDTNKIITICEWTNFSNTVQVLNTSNCLPLGISEINNRQIFSIYPNPTNSIVTIKRPSGSPENFKMYDTYGRLVISKIIHSKESQIDISILSEGIYFVRIGMKVSKLIKKYSW
jgi:hypothetical protein